MKQERIKPSDMLLEAMVRRKLTHETLAKKTGIEVHTIKMMLNDQVEITNIIARRLCMAFGGHSDFWENLWRMYKADVEKTRLERNRRKKKKRQERKRLEKLL